MSDFPSISIVTVSYNANLKLFKQSLDARRSQEYPQNIIEQIVVDGGSDNGTIELARKYGCIVLERPDLYIELQARMSVGMKAARNQILLFLQPDNIMVGKKWLQEMVLPYMENKDVFCTFSVYNSFLKHMSPLTKYCALIGATDPPVCYLGKSDKMPLDQKIYDKGEIVKNRPKYYVVKFTHENLPTLGDNGHTVRRHVIEKVNKDPRTFLHTDAFFHLVGLGYNTCGAVKNSMIHHTGSDVLALYKRRVLFKERFRDRWGSERIYRIFDYHSAKDRWNLFKFMIFSFTFVEPFIRAVRGYMKIHEPAWFLHPVVCFVAVVYYTRSEVNYLAQKYLKG